ncbi:hypothetical protein AC1031_010987 [Aphanomyces cochlioides]|nr:hypothetical protein AC1031_010987 [Aphanomyces cochlioides]
MCCSLEIWHEFRDSSNQEITTAHKHIHALETQAQLDRAAWHAKEQSLLDRIQVLQMELHISKAKPTDSSVVQPKTPQTASTRLDHETRHKRRVEAVRAAYQTRVMAENRHPTDNKTTNDQDDLSRRTDETFYEVGSPSPPTVVSSHPRCLPRHMSRPRTSKR